MAFNWGSMLGGGEGGGGGSQGGFGQMSSMMNIAGNINSKVQSSLEEPYKARRERLVALAPMYEDIGSSIGPVASSRGGAQMGAAMMSELRNRQRTNTIERGTRLDRSMRQLHAGGEVARKSAAIVRKIAELAAGGYGAAAGAGAAGGATAAGTGAGMTPAAGGGAMSAGAPVYGLEAGSYGSGAVAGASTASTSPSWWEQGMDLYDRYSRFMPDQDEDRRRY